MASLTKNHRLDYHEVLIRELTIALGYITQLRSLLQHAPPVNNSTPEVADVLLNGVLSSINAVLSVLEPSTTTEQTTPLVQQPPPAHCIELDSRAPGEKRKCGEGGDGSSNRKKRSFSNSNELIKVEETDRPYHDGYEWRKYGQKAINGSKFNRNYYRCTYREDQRCMAKKLVQQINENDPPFYRVTYTHNHACKPTHAPLPETLLQCSSLPQQQQPFLLHSSSSSSVESKQDLSPRQPSQFQTQCTYTPEIYDKVLSPVLSFVEPCDQTEIPWDAYLWTELWQW